MSSPISDKMRKNTPNIMFNISMSLMRDLQLVGVLRLRDLLMAPPGRRLSSMMIPSPMSVLDSTSLQDLQHFFDSHPLFGLPVVDESNVLVGVVRREMSNRPVRNRPEKPFCGSRGLLGGEELRSLPLKTRSARRLSWLSINIVLNVVAASVIAMYEDTLSSVIALAVFLPIVSDMSGCTGNQAIAVSTRELVLGVIRPVTGSMSSRKNLRWGQSTESHWDCCWESLLLSGKETPTWDWLSAAPWLPIPDGGLPGSIDSAGAQGLQARSALASGPILTTLTDMCGFFLVLSFAQAFLPLLV